jgi:hypothetical protein
MATFVYQVYLAFLLSLLTLCYFLVPAIPLHGASPVFNSDLSGLPCQISGLVLPWKLKPPSPHLFLLMRGEGD